jgi:hypothetical protein
MAHPFAVPSLGETLIARLRQAWPQQGGALPACSFALLNPAQLARPIDSAGLEVGLLLHHIAPEHADRGIGRSDPLGLPAPLALELHYLLTVRGADAAQEQLALAWAVAVLQSCALLDSSSLPQGAGWSAQERIEVLMAPLGCADLQAIWRALGLPQRLSVGYVARGVVLDEGQAGAGAGGGLW